MKQYRLKEEAKKYLQDSHIKQFWDKTEPLQRWLNTTCLSEEALEEVKSKIELRIDDNDLTLRKGNPNDNFRWSMEERQDIEEFLNLFGSMEGFYNKMEQWYLQSEIPLLDWLKNQ